MTPTPDNTPAFSDADMLYWLQSHNKDLICWHVDQLWIVGHNTEPAVDCTGPTPRAAIAAAMLM